MACDPPFPCATCDWPIDIACSQTEWDALDPDVQDRSVQFASATLRRLTAYRVGGCLVTVRPCKPVACTGPSYQGWLGGSYGPYFPHMGVNGLWVNSCGCPGDCSCGVLCEIDLPGPVGFIDNVTIDGTVQSPLLYRVDGTKLLWLGDGCLFPACQDMTLPLTETGTFGVTYLNAYPVDALGAYAAGVLAFEYAKACSNKACRLPKGTTQVVRQGVSITIAAGSFPGGLTGISEVDSYIALWNPAGLRQAPMVWSPDLAQPRVVG